MQFMNLPITYLPIARFSITARPHSTFGTIVGCLDLLGTVPSTFGTILKTPTTFLCGTHRHKTCPFPLAPITMAMHVTRQHYLGINTLPNTPSPHSMLSAMGTNGHRIASSILLLPRSMCIEWFPPTFQMCRYPSHNPAR